MYRAPAPGEPAFVKEGDKVTKGQTVCIIEAMKLMNEIEVRGGEGGGDLRSPPSGLEGLARRLIRQNRRVAGEFACGVF
jgi:hypothetical protein